MNAKVGRRATETLVDFARSADFDSIPPEVVGIGTAILVDSVGCALAGRRLAGGRIAVEVARDFGSGGVATIIGGPRTSLLGAAFVNGELINALGMDPVLVPGHVTPYVLPSVMAAAELAGSTGRDLVRAIVVAHEVACRVSGALSPLRSSRMVDGQETVSLSDASGYGSSIFGATIGAGLLLGLDREQALNSLGISGYFAPVPGLAKYLRSPYSPMMKYASGGWISAGGLLAARQAALGFTGDREVLDGDFGFWRMYASERCDFDFMLEGLGSTWHMAATEFKPYPSFRMGHAAIESFITFLETSGVAPEEIEAVEVHADPIVASPVNLNRDIALHSDAYMSWSHVLGAAAYYPPGPGWQSPECIRDPRVAALSSKVRVLPDPGRIRTSGHLNKVPTSPVEIRVMARGRLHALEAEPVGKGHPGRPFSAEESDRKFIDLASTWLPARAGEELLSSLKGAVDEASLARMFERLSGGPDDDPCP